VAESMENQIEKKTTDLDQLVQILEISFIFLLIFSLVALFDAVIEGFGLYAPISDSYLGREGVGSLNGGNWEEIVRITLIFNLLLFIFSLVFGLWIRRTRDNWTFKQMGYTLNTEGYSFKDLIGRGFLLGLIAIVIFYIARVIVVSSHPELNPWYSFTFFKGPNDFFTPNELNSEYFFGIVEMGFIWPLSAGFFFFAYAHNSLRAKFPTGVANVLSTFFYVFYLQFFFLIPSRDKLTQFGYRLTNSGELPPGAFLEFWMMTIALWLISYINFSAFAETKSIVLPFLMNFVLNVGITLIQAFNTLVFDVTNPLMILPFLVILLIIMSWSYFKPGDFSTIRIGINELRGFTQINLRKLFGFILIFVILSTILPGWINEILFFSEEFTLNFVPWLYALNFALLIILAIIVLTYEPAEVYDVLLLSNEGTPIASRIKLFETDEVLISGFFTALSAVDQELSKDSGLKSIKRGKKEILIEDGVFTRIIAFTDRDVPAIREAISKLHRKFEIDNGSIMEKIVSIPSDYVQTKKFVDEIGDLSVTFTIPQQTRWIGAISLAVGPLIIFLIGLL
jgi:hypothetical protein